MRRISVSWAIRWNWFLNGPLSGIFGHKGHCIPVPLFFYEVLFMARKWKNFFFDKDLSAQTIRIGTDNGVTGVFYTIVKDGTTLRVSCVHNA